MAIQEKIGLTQKTEFEKWTSRLPEYCRKEAIQRTKRKDFSVFIEYRTDLSFPMWAIIDTGPQEKEENTNISDDFWMEATLNKFDALTMCENLGWKIKEIKESQK